MKPSPDKNTSVFLDRDLSRAETQSRGEGVGRKERIDRKDWKCVKLGEFELHRNNTCARSLMTSDNGKMQNIHYGDILVKFNEIVSLEQTKIDYLTAEGENCAPKDYIQNGDIVIADTAEDETVGKMIEVQDVGQQKVVAGLHTILYRPPSNLFARGWLGYWMNTTAYHSQLNQYMTGIKVLSLSKSSLANTLIHYPPKTKQQQIVAALDSVQRYITSLQALIAKYDAVKKATVNLLLEPRPGWEKVKFSDVCSSFEYGVGAPAMSFDGRNKYIRITDIDDTSHEFKPTPLSSPTFFDNNHVVRDGDILFARTGASVGKSYLYCPTDGKLIFAGFLIRASICTNVVDPKFIFLQTLTAGYRQWVSEESMRSGQPGLNINQYKDFELYLPELSEQRKIATQISAIDNVLKDCHAQLAKAQNLKQGMMSYFFG